MNDKKAIAAIVVAVCFCGAVSLVAFAAIFRVVFGVWPGV